MSKKVQSHVQMPRLILKKFQNEKQEIFYYDFVEKKVKKGRAKTLYTEEGYYSIEIEQFLDSKVESPLGKLVNFLINTEFENNEVPPKNYQDIAFNYLYSLFSRAPKMLDEINKHSCWSEVLPKDELQDIVAHDMILIAREKNMFKEYKIAFLKNKSSEQLLLPTSGVVNCGKRIICPISPYDAVVFDDKKEKSSIVEENKEYISVYEVVNKKIIHVINLAGVMQENINNHKYVVGMNRIQLEEIVDEAFGIIREAFKETNYEKSIEK